MVVVPFSKGQRASGKDSRQVESGEGVQDDDLVGGISVDGLVQGEGLWVIVQGGVGGSVVRKDRLEGTLQSSNELNVRVSIRPMR